MHALIWIPTGAAGAAAMIGVMRWRASSAHSGPAWTRAAEDGMGGRSR
jgi:hypothetical protein